MKKKLWLFGILIVVMCLSLLCGRYGSSVEEVIDALFLQNDSITQKLIWNIRMPRIILVGLCGGALALSGIVYQTIFKNPLASGDVIGASSGCSLGAIIAILLSGSTIMVEVFSFAAGLIAVFLTILLANKVKGNRILNLVIAGLIIQAITTSLMMMLKISADPFHQLASIEYWLMGGFSDAGWMQVLVTFIIVLVCSLLLYLLRWQIQMLSFGDEATTMGISANKMRLLALVLATLLISSVISVAGIVSWVGLLVPHMIKMITKEQISKNMVTTFLCGAIFLLVCDTLARTMLVIELPISILTSLFGALFLIVLFVKGRFPL